MRGYTTTTEQNLLRELFLQRLPGYVQMTLATASTLDLNRLASLAEKSLGGGHAVCVQRSAVIQQQLSGDASGCRLTMLDDAETWITSEVRGQLLPMSPVKLTAFGGRTNSIPTAQRAVGAYVHGDGCAALLTQRIDDMIRLAAVDINGTRDRIALEKLTPAFSRAAVPPFTGHEGCPRQCSSCHNLGAVFTGMTLQLRIVRRTSFLSKGEQSVATWPPRHTLWS
ncbi:hypothetical protein HPB51_015737 [Rhipicephalus microplus]|uniref:Uncharacterized protein n=1 Tax=Rhipicephalus microplus TaxID=6941 RepID=A0A9J6EU14_RHIMP|nr:hypothetical protein HPB51_015737 [Rhipicephalus microplus]